jgi:uncharacterized membrane-anchored protein
MKAFMLSLLCSLGFLGSRAGDDPADSTKWIMEELRKIDSIESSLHYKTGTVVLENGLATINIAKGYKFLEAKEARYILEDVWGNMKGQTALGMILPENSSASMADYAFIVEYDPIGDVIDEDADKIDYEELLASMKEESKQANIERTKAGLESMDLVGWATKPYYDKEKKLLYWAKEYAVSGAEENTLNYDIRVLGRKGVLTLQAISQMSQFDSVDKNINNILAMVSFNKGNQYADFDSNVDDVAAWTIGGLVAGKILAKAGILALILKNIKLVILGVAALGGGIWKFVTGRRKRKEEEETFYQQKVEEPEQV